MPIDRAGNGFRAARSLGTNPRSLQVRDWVGTRDRQDYYTVFLNRPSTLQVMVSGLRANANVHVYNQQRQRIGRSAWGGRRFELLRNQLAPGRYYIHVFQGAGSTSYRLTLNSVTDWGGDRRPQSFNLGTVGNRTVRDTLGWSDRHDWYRLEVSEESRLRLTLHRTTNDAQMRLYNQAGSLMRRWRINNQPVEQQVGAGTYYVQLFTRRFQSNRIYDLGLTAVPINPRTPPEPSNLQFRFSLGDDVPDTWLTPLQDAGALWQDRFSDDVELNVKLQVSDTLVGAASTLVQFTYDQVREALAADQTSEVDAIALQHLPTDNTLSLHINYTADNPNGSGSDLPYLDDDGNANNQYIRMTTANAKALGLDPADGLSGGTFLGGDPDYDAVILLPESQLYGYDWDFDPSNGITDGTVDFVGILAHELGHVLGFSSGVDALDRGITTNAERWTWLNTLDLFRFSPESLALDPEARDWSAGPSDAIFSIDGGTTRLASFGTGIRHGNGIFPGHWNDDTSGIMSATLSPFIGQSASISNTDSLAIDVIGWDPVS